MKILDWYILKRYVFTFLALILLFVPIGIIINLSEKIGKILEKDAPLPEVLQYYLDFTIHFATLLFPLFLFLSVIWFTSKLANNTEVIAFLSSGVSFYRFLRPYMLGASVVALLSLYLGMYLAPKASEGYNEFSYKYFKSSSEAQDDKNVHRQINDHDYIYVSNFSITDKRGSNFTLEHIVDDKLVYKINATSIRYIEEDSAYRLVGYVKRTIGKDSDKLETRRRVDTIFPFDLEDLTPVKYIAETLNYHELTRFIEKEKKRGSSYIGRYELVKQRKWSLPISVFILTIIAVAVSSIKRRGGMGLNLAIGVSMALVYVFFDKIFGVMAEQSDFSPFVAVWFPNLLFGFIAVILLVNAKR